MKNFITLLFLVIVISQSALQAQAYKPFIKPNAYWDEYKGTSQGSCTFEGADRYFFKGDTVINGLLYHAMVGSIVYGIPSAPGFCDPYTVDTSNYTFYTWLREDTFERKLYRLDDNFVEKLVLNFALQEGDTLPNGNQTVDSIRFVSFTNGDERKVTYVRNGGIMVEGIGAIRSPFLGVNIVHVIAPYLICYSENQSYYSPQNVLFYLGNNCTNLVSSTSEPHVTPYPISPNPTDDLLSIQIPDNIKPTQLIVTDISGKVVHQKNDWQPGTPLEVGILPSGMYFLVVEDRHSDWRGIWKFVRR